jgi:hypothetical protein
MDRAEHLAWAKQRAHELADAGHNDQALASLVVDLASHDELQRAQQVAAGMGMPQLIMGMLDTPEAMHHFIDGIN